MSHTSSFDETDGYGRPAPVGAERWLVGLPLVAILGLVIVVLLAMFVAVMLGGSR